MSFIESLNSCLDQLPRPRLGSLGREVPSFRTCGIAGYYVALIVLFAGGLLTGRSSLVLAMMALIGALSFYAYTYLRMWITGQETLVLLEHVWFALAGNAAALWAMGEPLLPYLDVFSIGLCAFLAAGRVGCTLVGCCHGRPSSLGVTYNDACAVDGFQRHLVGVRLFPVPAIEAVGLLAIGAVGLIALPLSQPGKVFAWYLLAYSVLRFGLEGMRGDRRPYFLGLSQARWMAIIEADLALGLTTDAHHISAMIACLSLSAALIVALSLHWRRDRRRLLLQPSHVREVREVVRLESVCGPCDAMVQPSLQITSQQLAIGISAIRAGSPETIHVSLSLPHGRSDLALLCELAARAFPELVIEEAQFTVNRVLHLRMELTEGQAELPLDKDLGLILYGSVVRRAQFEAGRRGHESYLQRPEPLLPVTIKDEIFLPETSGSSLETTPWYYADVSGKRQG